MENNDFLATEKMGVLMQKYAIPCIISLLVGALYNIVDQIFIANAAHISARSEMQQTRLYFRLRL